MGSLRTFVALVLSSTVLPAQATSAAAGKQASASPAPIDTQLTRLRERGARNVPTPDRFSWGDQTVAAGATVTGPIAVARGNLDVFGTVHGDAYVLDGEIRVHRGATITGA